MSVGWTSWLLGGTALAALMAANAGAVAAPRALGDEALDRVIAGTAGTSPAGSTAGSGPLAGMGGRGGGGLEAGGPVLPGPRAGNPPTVSDQSDPPPAMPPGRREAIVGHDSRLDLELHAAVRLTDGTQSGLRALSLANASAADAASALNVFDGGRRAGDETRLLIDQRNELTQIETLGASVGAFSVSGPTTRTSVAESFHSSSTSSRSFTDSIIDRSRTHRREYASFSASVPEFSPLRDWEVNLNVGKLPDIELPGFSFDGTVGSEPFRFGAAANVTGAKILGPGLNLGSIRGDGDDIVIRGGSITLPGITLPTIRGELCLFKCAAGEIIGASIGGQTASLDVGEIRFEGANPFKDLDLQLGRGIVAVGTGRFEIGGIDAELTASFSFDLPSLGGQTIGFDLIPDLGFLTDAALKTIEDLGLRLPRSIRKTVELPEIDLPGASFEVTLLDFKPGNPGNPGFSGSFTNAVLCSSFVTVDCSDQSLEVTEFEHVVNNRSMVATAFESFREEWSRTESSEQRPGAELREAEAELIAMSGAEVTVSDYSLVIISGEAQRGLAAMNVANVTTAMVGSAANVARTPAGVRGAKVSGMVTQTNIFVQGFTGR